MPPLDSYFTFFPYWLLKKEILIWCYSSFKTSTVVCPVWQERETELEELKGGGEGGGERRQGKKTGEKRGEERTEERGRSALESLTPHPKSLKTKITLFSVYLFVKFCSKNSTPFLFNTW